MDSDDLYMIFYGDCDVKFCCPITRVWPSERREGRQGEARPLVQGRTVQLHT